MADSWCRLFKDFRSILDLRLSRNSKTLVQVWEEITQDIIHGLIRSMPHNTGVLCMYTSMWMCAIETPEYHFELRTSFSSVHLLVNK